MIFHSEDHVIICNQTALNFTNNVARYLAPHSDKITVFPVHSEPFNNGEIFVQLPENIREKRVHLFFQFYDPKYYELIQKRINDGFEDPLQRLLLSMVYQMVNRDLMELLIIGDAVKRAGAQRVNLYIPFIPYLRQDKKDEGRVPITARTFFDIVEAAFGDSLKRYVTFEMHANQEQGFTNLPCDNIPLGPLYGMHILNTHQSLDDLVLVAADVGGGRIVRPLAKLLGVPYAIVDKRRTGHGQAEASRVVGDVTGKKSIIIEDIIDTGGSIIVSDEILHKFGATSVEAYATHGIFGPKTLYNLVFEGETVVEKIFEKVRFAEDLFGENNVKIITTNSIPRSAEYLAKNRSWLTQIGLDRLMAEILLRNIKGQSVSGIIEEYKQRVKNRNPIDTHELILS